MKKIIAIFAASALIAAPVCVAETLREVLPSEFLFASGAGAWGTDLTLNADMSFSGNYSDSEMGEIGEGYEYGSCYISLFSGNFTEPVAQADGTETMTVASLTFENEPGEEMIEDDVRYVYDEPYGISEGDEFICYPSGYPTADMEESALEWAALTCAWSEDEIPETLPVNVLYNSTEGYAFTRQWFED